MIDINNFSLDKTKDTNEQWNIDLLHEFNKSFMIETLCISS